MKKVDQWYSTLTQGDRDYAEAHCYDGLLKGAFLAGWAARQRHDAEIARKMDGKSASILRITISRDDT